MKLIKNLIKAVLLLVVLMVVAVVGLVLMIDPNDYKPQIVQAAKEATGRDLTIAGDISWSFFPRLGFAIGETELSNADGFQSPVFAKVEKIDAGLLIMPLFKGQVELDTVNLIGMVANLEINNDGTTNWDDLSQAGQTGQASDGEAASEPASTEQTSEASTTELPPIRLQGIRIADAQVSYTDRAGGTAVLLEDFDFSTGVVKLWDPIAFEGSFKVENKYPQLAASFNYSGTLIAKVLENQFGLQGFELSMDAKGEPIPNGAIALSIAADIAANTAKETAELEQLTIRFDETTINGKAKVNNFTKPAIKFDVAIDQLNADRYIPVTEATEESESADAAAVTESDASSANSTDADPVIELPMQTLRDLDVQGQLTVGKFQVMNLKTQDFKAVLSAKNGLIELQPLGITMYDGVFDGAVTVDARKAVPAYGVKAKLANMQINPLLVDFAELDVVEGAGGFDIDITTRGQRVSELKRGLNGSIAAEFDKGVLKFNMFGGLEDFVNGLNDKLNTVGALSALAGKQDTADKITKAQDTATFTKLMEGETTQFNALKVSGDIVDGVIRTKDLDVQSDDFSAQGQGSVDIATEYLDMQLALKQDEFACTIPLQGKIIEIDYAKFAKRAAPNCLKSALKDQVDSEKERLKAELEAKKQQLEAEAKARIEEEKAKAKAKLEAEKAKAEAELKAKIEAEKKKAKDKLNEKLGDALKDLF